MSPRSLVKGTDPHQNGERNKGESSNFGAGREGRDGDPMKGQVFDFSPTIDLFLKTHLFADIFSRDNLDWQSREIATISMLATLDGLGAQAFAGLLPNDKQHA